MDRSPDARVAYALWVTLLGVLASFLTWYAAGDSLDFGAWLLLVNIALFFVGATLYLASLVLLLLLALGLASSKHRDLGAGLGVVGFLLVLFLNQASLSGFDLYASAFVGALVALAVALVAHRGRRGAAARRGAGGGRTEEDGREGAEGTKEPV